MSVQGTAHQNGTGQTETRHCLDPIYTQLVRERLGPDLQDTEVRLTDFDDPDTHFRVNCFTHTLRLNTARLHTGDMAEVLAASITQLERGCNRLRAKHDCGVEVRLMFPARDVDEAVSLARQFLSHGLVRMKDALGQSLYYEVEGVDLD